jgi:hypothetical protein
MLSYTLEITRRGIQIDFMENRLRIPIFPPQLVECTQRTFPK